MWPKTYLFERHWVFMFFVKIATFVTMTSVLMGTSRIKNIWTEVIVSSIFVSSFNETNQQNTKLTSWLARLTEKLLIADSDSSNVPFYHSILGWSETHTEIFFFSSVSVTGSVVCARAELMSPLRRHTGLSFPLHFLSNIKPWKRERFITLTARRNRGMRLLSELQVFDYLRPLAWSAWKLILTNTQSANVIRKRTFY